MPDVIHQIGLGLDYETIALWITATDDPDGDLTGTDRYIGELQDAEYIVDGDELQLTAVGNTTASNYRMLRRSVTNGVDRHNPYANTGPRIIVRWANGTGDEDGLFISEDYFRLLDVGIYSSHAYGPTGGDRRLIHIQGSNTVISQCALVAEHGSSNSASDVVYTGIYINGASGVATADNNTVFTTIIKGTTTNRGLATGVEWGAFCDGGGCYHVGVWGCSAALQSRGFVNPSTTAPAAPELINCYALEIDGTNSCFVGQWTTFQNNASSDSTADQGTDSIIFATSDNSFLAPDQRDFRLRFSSIMTDAGTEDVATAFITANTSSLDLESRTRIGVTLDIGPYEGSDLPQNATPPTVVTTTIGSDGSRDRATLQDWIDNDLSTSPYFTNEIHRAELYDDSEFTPTDTIRLEFQNTSSSRYIEIVAADGQRYDPRSGRGVRLTGNGGPATYDVAVLDIRAPWTVVRGMRINHTTVGSAPRTCLEVHGVGSTIDAVFAWFPDGTGVSSRCFDIWADRVVATNCIARGNDVQGTGAAIGYAVRISADNVQLLHCVAYRIRGNATEVSGFLLEAGLIGTRVSGCVSIDHDGNSSSTDFNLDVSLTPAAILDHCISEDATSVGQGAQPSATISTIFNDPVNDDYRLASGSPATNAGATLTEFLSADFIGALRFAPYDIGVYEGEFYVDLVEAPAPLEAARWCTCIEITRTDGETGFFTDSNEPIIHAGQTYEPTGGFTTSAKRAEGGLKEHNTDLSGAISSEYITDNDLATGRYSGARVRIFYLDQTYTWTLPKKEFFYLLSETTFDGEAWSAELVGMTTRLELPIGENVTVGCPYAFGDLDCSIDVRELRLLNGAITTVDNDRRTFRIAASPSQADDYWGAGIATFVTGDNAGLSFRIKNYTDVGRIFELHGQTPSVIQVTDTVDITPGCRKRYVADCITKWTNGVNFGGRPFMPGTDRSFDTPTR